jgi:hypothetical protein
VCGGCLVNYYHPQDLLIVVIVQVAPQAGLILILVLLAGLQVIVLPVGALAIVLLVGVQATVVVMVVATQVVAGRLATSEI